MRIVFVISNLLQGGGAETQMIGLSRELSRMGHEVAIYTLNRHNPRAAELGGTGVQVIADQKSIKLDPAVLMRLRRFIRYFRADIVHSFLFDADIYSRIAGIGLGLPIINSERDDDYRLRFLQGLIHYPTRNFARAVIANSHSGARFARKLFGFGDNRISCVWNGIDLNIIDKRIKDSNRNYREDFFGNSDVKVACLVGRISPQKDYFLALDVAESLLNVNPCWRVLFVGEQMSSTGAYKSQVLEKYQAMKHRDRIYFTGLRNDVIEILSQCDVLFSTSHHEGFPNVVLEAMSAGTPVVSTVYSDIERILPLSWQIIPGRNAETIAQAIIRADQERALVTPMQREWVEANATITVSATRLLEAYKLHSQDSIVN